MNIELIIAGLLQGLILALVAYAVMIPFRLLNLPDLTAEGAYPLAGAVCAVSLSAGFSPMIAMLFSTISAGVAGIGTGLIYHRFKINSLLAGILLSTMLYSINLKIMGKPNMALFDTPSLLIAHHNTLNILILFSVIGLFLVPFATFLHTTVGLRFRAVGLNPVFAKKQAISIGKYTVLGLFIAHAATGLAGSCMVQLQNYMDIGMGIGIVIHALAALMIGECVIGNNTLTKQLLAPLVGALIYQQIQGLALFVGLLPTDLKLFTGMIVLAVLAISKREKI